LTDGFVIPKFESSQQWGCPVYNYEVSSYSEYLVKHQELEDPVFVSSDRVVYPKDKSLHRIYKFYLKITAEGGSNAMFGDFDLYVGCTNHTVKMRDSPFLQIHVPVKTGDDPENIFWFSPPISSKSDCNVLKNEVVETDGTFWLDPKVVPA